MNIQDIAKKITDQIFLQSSVTQSVVFSIIQSELQQASFEQRAMAFGFPTERVINQALQVACSQLFSTKDATLETVANNSVELVRRIERLCSQS